MKPVKIEIKGKKCKSAIPRFRSFFIICIAIFSPVICSGVEGMYVDIPYPITPPGDLLQGIEEWKYQKPTPHFLPLFFLGARIDQNRKYDAELTTGFSYAQIKQKVEVKRKQISLFDNTHVDYASASFHNNEDSLFCGYKTSSWWNLQKDITDLASHFTAETKGFIFEVSSRTRYFAGKNDYELSSSIHRLYGYENMLSFQSSYSHSPFFTDRNRLLHSELRDRFAFKDYFFVIPGIAANLLSQTSFSPFLKTIFLVNKNLSIESSIVGSSLDNNLESYYELPFTAFPESLVSPFSPIKATLQVYAFADTSTFCKLNICARKTRYPIIPIQERQYYLGYQNLDTTISFVDMSFELKISKCMFTVNPQLRFSYTPFYEQHIAYTPTYKLSADIIFRPNEKLTFLTNTQYAARIYDCDEGEIAPYFTVSSLLNLKIMKNVTLTAAVLNINNSKKNFIGDTHFAGRIMSSSIGMHF